MEMPLQNLNQIYIYRKLQYNDKYGATCLVTNTQLDKYTDSEIYHMAWMSDITQYDN